MKTEHCSKLSAVAWLVLLASASAQTTFTKVLTGPVVTDQGQFVKAAWGDFHNSGFLDLVVCNWGGRTNVYYQNNGGGSFTKIFNGDPVQDRDYHSTPVIGDYDNDGALDLLVTAGVGAVSPTRSRFYHNLGDGTFTLATGGGVANQAGYFDAGASGDYDNDGLLDLVQVEDSSQTMVMWHNRGEGLFTRVTSSPWNLSGAGAVFFADYDNDGWLDLLVTGTGSINYLFHNEGHGAFRRILTNSVATDQWPGGSECATWGDYDNDGLPDLFITGDNGSPNRLYHNNGDGTFTRVPSAMDSRPAGADSLTCAWGDYDNDGYLDLFVATTAGPTPSIIITGTALLPRSSPVIP